MNSELYGNTYPIPKEILNKINAKIYTSPTGNGIKRAKGLVNSGNISYEQMKRLKNFFDNFNAQTTSKDELDYAGGNEMKMFIDQQLGNERDRTAKSKEIKKPTMVMANSLDLTAQNGEVNLRESEQRLLHNHEGWLDRIGRKKIPEGEILEGEEIDNNLTKNALAIIFNNDMEVLLLQRSSYKEQWMPEKIALVGGGVEEGEEPVEAVQREIKEETGLDINKFIEKFVLQRNEDSVEHMFIAKYDGDNDDVELNDEHQDYGWYSIDEIDKLDTVPNLMDYVKIALTKYE